MNLWITGQKVHSVLSDGVMGNVLHSVEFRDDGTLL